MRIKFTFMVILIGLATVIINFSCNKEVFTDIIKQEELKLKSPSGLLIANDFNELKAIAIPLVNSHSPSDTIFSITKIDFFDTKTGYAAIVSYKTLNGYENNFALVKDVKVAYTASLIKTVNTKNSAIKDVETNIQNQSNAEVTVSCAGSCGCRVEGTIKTDGTITFGCSCTECTATIKY